MAVRSRAVNAAHTAGIFAYMSLDGPEIGTLVAVVDRARNLPNRKTMGKQDPYCAMRLGKEAKKTNTDRRGGQTPKWDQELRFTVHDSPDYYKLKCSIFNDDKKTDLIGEAWIDLGEVIVSGGGQNDLWHQLNFKGKYAGDVRVELTYYDTRPQPEPSSGRRSQRGKAHSTVSDAVSTASTSRQLGPREIKRRPLPPGPGGYSSPAAATETPEPWSSEEVPSNTRTSSGYTNSHPPPRPPKQRIPETPDDVGYGFDSRFEQDAYDTPPHPYAMEEQRPASNQSYSDFDRLARQHSDTGSYRMDPYEPDGPRPVRKSLSQQTEDLPSTTPTEIPIQDSPRNVPNQSPYQSSPPVRPPARPSSSLPAQPQPWQSRSSTSPNKHVVYRDSPLRQSISHVDLPLPEAGPGYADPRFDEDDCPPPPPAHRDQIARTQATGPSYQNPHGHPSPHTPHKYSSVEERSPLQKLERDYGIPQGSPPSVQRYPQQLPPVQPYDQRLADDHKGYSLPPEDRRRSHDDQMMQLRSSSANDLSLHEYSADRSVAHQHYNGNLQNDFRHSTGYGPPRRAQTFESTFEAFDDRQTRRSEPAVGPPRAFSPGMPQTIPRKSVTPTPATPEDGSSISSIPYGPDSYDVLNPGPSPTVEDDPYAAPDQNTEAARQREAERLRDQGPIIGNDGRVIDPSDHLPADTWAPEPERKNRQPEHVIRIRTKEETRMQNRGGSSPASAMPRSIPNSPYQPSPPATLPSPSQSSSAPPTPSNPSPQAESASGRNRLRKQMPTRPLPAQPYALPESSPAMMPASSNEVRPSPPSQRYTILSSPAGPLPQRPSMSDYQIPATNDYSPRGGPPFSQYPSTPTKAPSSRRGDSASSAGYDPEGSLANGVYYGSENFTDHKGYGPDYRPDQASVSRPRHSMDQGAYGRGDSLALELSTIDIGPSRAGRTALRPVRGHGGY